MRHACDYQYMDIDNVNRAVIYTAGSIVDSGRNETRRVGRLGVYVSFSMVLTSGRRSEEATLQHEKLRPGKSQEL